VRDVHAAQAGAPRILCAGIIVLDEVFYVESLPPPDGKVEAKEFFIVNGGCAANAAVTVARLGGRATLAGPMGSDATATSFWRRSRARRSTARPVSAFPDWRRRCRRSSSTRAATAPS
jgi:sugar/nucleoside kinase (ribokinase family)